MSRIETQTRTLYTFDELSDGAKERARDWWRGILAEDTQWSESTIEDADTIAAILGISITRERYCGKVSTQPSIYWSLARDGGVGFDASYSYARGSVAKIREHAPQDETLHRIVAALQRAQRSYFYKLNATVRTHGNDGLSLAIDVEADAFGQQYAGRDVDTETADSVTEAIEDFAHWIHSALQREYDWLMDAEQVDEDIRANEYEFTETGERA